MRGDSLAHSVLTVSFEVSKRKVELCSPSPKMLASFGKDVFTRRYCGSKIKGWVRVSKIASPVDRRRIWNENSSDGEEKLNFSKE